MKHTSKFFLLLIIFGKQYVYFGFHDINVDINYFIFKKY